MKKIFLVLSLVFIWSQTTKALVDLTPYAKSAILLETTTGTILYEKNSHEKLAPASMTKLMGMLLVMEALDRGQIKLTDEVIISENAARMGGSQVFLQTGEKYPVVELLKGVAIASGNDAMVALAEKVSGTVEIFVIKMNARAKELGLRDTTFKNPHGLDEEGHLTSAYDMALIARELVRHPQILDYTGMYEYYLKKPDNNTTWLVNTNKLVRFYEGVDGLKTGFTQKAKYCLTATAFKNKMRLISVVMAEETPDKRSSETVKLLNYGFNGFRLNPLFKKNEVVQKVKIKKSIQNQVLIVLKEQVINLLKNDEEAIKYKTNLKLNQLTAPITKGQIIGYLEILKPDGTLIQKAPLTVLHNVKKATFSDYFKRNLKELLIGKNL